MPAPGRAGARRDTSTGTPALDGQLRGRIYRQLLGIGEHWERFDIVFDPFDRRVDPVLYHDIEAGFKFDSGVTVRAAITNVTDEDPPYLNIAPANTDVATYRLLGRSYFWNCVTTSSSWSEIAGAPVGIGESRGLLRTRSTCQSVPRIR